MGGGYCVFYLDRRKRKFGNYEEELSLLRCIGVGERSGRASIQAERHSDQGTRGEGKKEDMQEEKKIKRKNRVRLSRSYVQCLEVRHNEGGPESPGLPRSCCKRRCTFKSLGHLK